MKNILLKLSLACLLVISGCQDLDETIYSDIERSNFYSNELEVLQATLRPFTHMQAWLAWSGQSGYYYHNELSADQTAWPQKGRHGFDGGDHIRQHYHTWTATENRLNNAWRLMWTGVGYVNAVIEDVQSLDAENVGITNERLESIIAESKVLRAYHYMKIMDMWGNVPIVTQVGIPLNPPTADRKEIFRFIEKETLETVEQLQDLSPQLIGRVSKAFGYAMLSELYLNAEVWLGEPRYEESIFYANKLINDEAGSLNGALVLDDDILRPYSSRNEESTENIFQFPFSFKNGFGPNWRSFYMGFTNMTEALDVNFRGNNAFVVIPSAFDAYQENDLRKQEWFLFGPQFKFGTDVPILGTEEYDGLPFIYVNNIRRNSEGETGEGGMTQGEENSGARFHKYRSGRQTDPNYRENDYVVYRLTEMYFNKAEALMRLNGGVATQEAVDLINQSKRRYFSDEDQTEALYDVSNLTLDELLAERGREFIFEGKRRTDLIRFNKFVTANWWDHDPSGNKNLEIYPIPEEQLGINPNLIQNPGY